MISYAKHLLSLGISNAALQIFAACLYLRCSGWYGAAWVTLCVQVNKNAWLLYPSCLNTAIVDLFPNPALGSKPNMKLLRFFSGTVFAAHVYTLDQSSVQTLPLSCVNSPLDTIVCLLCLSTCRTHTSSFCFSRCFSSIISNVCLSVLLIFFLSLIAVDSSM